MKPINDPFRAITRIETDKTGLIFTSNNVTEGYIVFHEIVSNGITVINNGGEIIRRFNTPPTGYEIYRPAKMGNKNNIVCIIINKKNRNERSIACFDEKGTIEWKTKIHHWLTHDFIVKWGRTINKLVTVIREEKNVKSSEEFIISDNILLVMDINGEILWRWSLYENLNKFKNGEVIRSLMIKYRNDNPFHVNSVDLCNYDCIFKLYGEPIVIVSSRNMNMVFGVGFNSNEVKFELFNETIGQHHARILPENYTESTCHLIVFDNGISFLPEHKSRSYSRVIEYDLKDNLRKVWEYKSKNNQHHFFSPIVGSQQRFKNGNTLIAEGYYGRLFEIDYQGNIVWEYVFPDKNDISKIEYNLKDTGLRQIYRAYRVNYDWLTNR